DLDLRPQWAPYVFAVVLAALMLTPICSLVWKLGLAGHPQQWSWATAAHYVQSESRVLGGSLVSSLAVAAGGGLIVALLALIGCWLARDARWFRWLLFGSAMCAWVLPGPVVGIGLNDLIMALPGGPWKTALYYAPSPAPVLWAQVLRAFPIAVVF